MSKPNRKLTSAFISLALSLALILTLLPATALAVGETGSSGIWNFKVLADGTLSITGASISASMTLPETLVTSYGTKTVTRIENNAFKAAGTIFNPSVIETFTMPNSVTSIGDNAFYNCSTLRSVTLSDNLQSIGDSSFQYCTALTGVVIPDSVTSIGSTAFSGCTALSSITLASSSRLMSVGSQAFFDICITSISLPDSVNTIGDGAFNACRLLTSVTLPDNPAFTAIPDKLFFECDALTNVTIPDSVTSIGLEVFNDCESLQSITIPENVASIGVLAFVSCTSMKAINVDSNNTHFSSENGVLYNADKTELICGPAGWSGALHIPDGVASIDDYAFYRCAGLQKVYFPVSVSIVGDYAFAYCPGLTTAFIAGGSIAFGNSVFQNAAFASGGIYGRGGSTAQTYASANGGVPFYVLCIVSFDSKGGSDVPDLCAGEGDKLSGPAEPTLSGFAFGGWYKDSGCTDEWDIVNDTLSGDITLYAKWSAAQVPTYALTITAGAGGSIATGNSGQYAPGTVVSIAASAAANYSFSQWTSSSGGTFGDDTSAATSFTMPAGNTTITASFRYVGGGITPEAPPATNYFADVKGEGTGGTPLDTKVRVTVDLVTNGASLDVSGLRANLLDGSTPSVITVPSIPNVDTYTLGIQANQLAVPGGTGSLTIDTAAGSLTVSSGMLAGISGADGKKAEITIGQGDKSALPDDVKTAIGERPLISLSLSLNGTQTDWNNPGAPVTVSIPYTPTATERANPESIVIWYIDSSGNAVCIPNGHYDPVTGKVTFTTTHFSDYAVGYNTVSFTDVTNIAWYSDAVDFIAARGITAGTVNGKFSPAAKLTRGDFLVMLMKAYGIAPDTAPKDNFSDAGNTYYTGYLATAKKLGITAGIGNNMYAPGKEITRQEMFTLLYNALNVIGQLPNGAPGSSRPTLSDFTDADQIDAWAKEAMMLLVETGTVGGSDGKLNPTATTTRAEMAQVLYNLLSK